MAKHSFTLSARIVLATFALLLALPGLLSGIVDHEARQNRERRVLTTFPDNGQLSREPRAYFRQLDGYVQDHTAGSLLASEAYARLKYYAFGDSPSDLIHLGTHGTVFVHTMNPDNPFAANRLCMRRRQTDMIVEAEETLRLANTHLSEFGIDARLLVAPSKILLYGDRFTNAMPPFLQRSCRRYSRRAPLLAINEVEAGTVVYPLLELREERRDPSYYPVTNFHWTGRAIHTAMNAWIDRQPEAALRPLDAEHRTEIQDDDLTEIMGFSRPFEARVFDYETHAVSYSSNLPTPFRSGLESPQTPQHAMTENPVFDRRIVLFSNSFGNEAHRHIAPLYREMVWLNTNHLSEDDWAWLLEEWVPAFAPDSVIFLYHDVAVSRYLSLIRGALD